MYNNKITKINIKPSKYSYFDRMFDNLYIVNRMSNVKIRLNIKILIF